MIKSVSSALIGCVVLLGACASSPSSSDDEANTLGLQPAINSVPSSGLGPQQLESGECGLFLWSQTDTTKFIFFSKALSGRAMFAQDATPIRLTQNRAAGDIFGQFNSEMGYVSRDNRQIDLTIAPGEMLQGGQRIANGLLTLTDREGWQTKLPVLGVRACQRE